MVSESWLSRVGQALWSRRSRLPPTDKSKTAAPVGVLAFEVASLMSKVAHLWRSLADEQVFRLRDEVLYLPGVRKLVSDDDEFLLNLALSEILDNLASAARAVARLGRRCSNPVLQGLDNVFDELTRNPDPVAAAAALKWQFTGTKMKRKVKKMEKFVGASANLYQEMEVLAEVEQGLRRMRANEVDPNSSSFIEFQKKVVWQRQEVKYLKENSLWNRSFDYTVRLMARSLFTVFARIQYVFGIYPTLAVETVGESRVLDHLPRSLSTTHSSVHPSENSAGMFASGPLGRFRNTSRFASGPLTQSGPLVGGGWRSKTKKSVPKGAAFAGCMTGGGGEPPPILRELNGSVDPRGYLKSNGLVSGALNGAKEADSVSLLNSKQRLLSSAPPSTLGASALALHYANVIIVIEKMVTCPHLIAPDARDDLYNMLPMSIRSALRARLKYCSKSIGSVVHDTQLAAEWNEALAKILDWLAPLAHNMIRWQSERSYEQQHVVSKTNVLLLQTLYFANQAKTEAAITELLVGLNYICRVHRDINSKAFVEAAESVDLDDYVVSNG